MRLSDSRRLRESTTQSVGRTGFMCKIGAGLDGLKIHGRCNSFLGTCAVPEVGRACGCREPCHAPTSAFAVARRDDHRPSLISMIGHCGPPTRLPHARTHTELARAARPIRHGQGRRDPGAASRGRGAAPSQSALATNVGRSCVLQRFGQAAARTGTAAPAGLATNAAALACPARRPPLDLPATTTRPTTRRTTCPGAGTGHRSGEPELGLCSPS
jgi:hypothetical protein